MPTDTLLKAKFAATRQRFALTRLQTAALSFAARRIVLLFVPFVPFRPSSVSFPFSGRLRLARFLAQVNGRKIVA